MFAAGGDRRQAASDRRGREAVDVPRPSGPAALSRWKTPEAGPMTDKELIALVESKLPQELSLEEIDLVRRRMRASPTVRRALAAQVELDQYLAGLIGKVELSPEAIFAGASRSRRFGRGSIFSWLGWTACLLMLGFVVSM